MNKRLLILIVFVFVVILQGCQNDTHALALVLLNEDGSIYESYDEVNEGNFTLPILEVEDKTFVGWSDGQNIVADSIFIEKEMTLTASFEISEDVFKTTINPSTGQLVLDKYTGDATYLVIPRKVSGRTIESIGTESFNQSDVEILKISEIVRYIDEYAFKDANHLKSISFYGSPKGSYITRMSEEVLENFLDKNTDGCTIAKLKGYGEETTSEDQCSVVTSFAEDSFWLDREEIVFFHITIDIEKAPQYGKVMIGWHSFSDAPVLEEIHFPSWVSDLTAEDFESSNQISTITIPIESVRYRTIDNVIYSKDRTELIYYPSGLEETSFKIPSLTKRIMPYAFSHNDVLEEIIIPKNVEELEGGFIDMKALTHFEVSVLNEKYASRDGLLFSRPNFFLDEYRLEVYPGGLKNTSFTLPDDVIEIGDYAFAFNEHLTHLDLSNRIREIGHFAFYASKNIVILDIPESIRLIENNICGDSGVRVVIIRSLVEEDHNYNLSPVLAFQYLNKDVENHPWLYVPNETFNDYEDMLEDTVVIDFLKPLSEYQESID